MAEKLILGLSLTVLGMSITFFILFLLQLMMNVQAFVLNRTIARNRPRELQENNVTEETVMTGAPMVLTDSEKPPSTLSPQIVAAIMGAIAASTGQPVQTFRLVSIRQAGDQEASTAWSLNNRLNVINRRNSFYAKGGAK